jgi:hypothetical protein
MRTRAHAQQRVRLATIAKGQRALGERERERERKRERELIYTEKEREREWDG